MKTLEEIKNYLIKRGSNDESIDMIVAFLTGKGMYDYENDEVEYTSSNKTFKDFLEWFNGKNMDCKFEDDDFEISDYVHVKENIDVVVVSEINDGKFVGWDGNTLRVYDLCYESRPCNDDECSKLAKACNESGIVFNDMFETLVDSNEIEKEKEKLRDALDELDSELEKVKDIPLLGGVLNKVAKRLTKDAREFLEEDDNEKLDELRTSSHKAIDIIVDHIKKGNVDSYERALLDDAFNTLVELGDMYE